MTIRRERRRREVSGSWGYRSLTSVPVLRTGTGRELQGLARAEARAIGAEGSRAHASRQAGRRERRRHVAQGSAAVAALGNVIFGDAEPVTASVTFRIDALNSPARQILHGLPPAFSRGTASERARAKARNSGSDRKSWADNVPQFGGCQGEMPQDVVADWQREKWQSARVPE